MYGKQKNWYGNLVSELKGQLISAQSLLYIMYAYWQNLKTSVLPDAVLVNFDWMSWASKERRKEKLKGQLEKGILPLFCHALCLFPNTLCHFVRQKTKNTQWITKHQYLKTWKIRSCRPRICRIWQVFLSWMCTVQAIATCLQENLSTICCP